VSTLYSVWPVRGGSVGPGPDSAIPANLPRTGQLLSQAAGDDGALQHGVAWPAPHFTAAKDAGGQPCGVADHLTGLNWIADAAPGAVDFAGAQVAAGGTYCGFADWRLPNRAELVSLFDYATDSSVGPLTSAGLINTGATGGSQWVWTSTFDRWTDGDGFFGADLTTNQVMGLNVLFPTGQAYTWLVRAGTPPAPVTIASVEVTIPQVLFDNTGQTNQAQARVVYSDGSFKDVTTVAVWSSSDPAVALIDVNGLITSQNTNGTAIITAAIDTVVSPGVLVTLAIP
jgi:hypothetical protein